MGDDRMIQYHLVKHERTVEWHSLEAVPNGMFVLKADAQALEKRISELESALCETCKDPRCEDSVVEHLKQKVARLEKALREIDSGISYCICDAYRSRGEGEIICNKCIAKKALEGK
jgi:hypothetical protein